MNNSITAVLQQRGYIQFADKKPTGRFLYEATFQKWEKWHGRIVVFGKPVKIEKEGYRTYSTGPYNIGRNKLKRELKAAQRLRRYNRLRVVSTALLYNVPKIKLTMKAFVNA